MSYCRSVKDESEVFVFNDGVVHHVAHDINLNLKNTYFENKGCLYEYLYNIRKLGVLVPEYCLERLLKEIKDDNKVL